ncbi:OsmC family protein [Actinosynnema sp. NPDC020468]|uniref:OsmC family protein n=1 Tax=Actinosynnema sp. NPDC020468 TaxID=3154488 RepID=UPI0033DAF769
MSDVEVTRVAEHTFVATNDRGAEVRIGRKGAEGAFSPVELLLAAAAGCAAVTAETLITRRTGDRLVARAVDPRQGEEHELPEVPTALEYDASTLDEPQRAALEAAVRRAIAQLCTVSRTLEQGAPVPLTLPGATAD